MNLFNYVKLHGTSKGFIGKSFFIPNQEPEIFNCIICKEPVHDIKRLTCSSDCALQHKINTKSVRFKRIREMGNLKGLSKQMFLDLMIKKYGVKK